MSFKSIPLEERNRIDGLEAGDDAPASPVKSSRTTSAKRVQEVSVLGPDLDRQTLSPLMTAEEVAHLLRISPRTVHRLVREGKLGCVQISPRERRFTQDHIHHYVESQSIEITLDKKCPHGIPSPPTKGGEKSLGLARTALKEEMRSWR